MAVTPSAEASLRLFLQRLLVRSVLSDEEQQAILDLPAHLVELRKKQDFVHINEEISHACLIVSGMVARFGQTASGARQITAFHIPGDMADLHSAVRPIGVGGLNALCATTILRVPHGAIRDLAARYPAIAEAFWRDCMLDAAVLMQWVVNVGRRTARTRIAHVLCEMAVRSGRDRNAAHEYAFPVTQEQLGDATALTSVHVNRSLKTLDSLATVKAGTVRIHDWDALARAGDFDARYLVADAGPERQKRLLAA
jgi:CRP-like cAMP-binding protein